MSKLYFLRHELLIINVDKNYTFFFSLVNVIVKPINCMVISNYTHRSQLELQPQETPKEWSNFAENKKARGKPEMSVSHRLTLLRIKKNIHALKCLKYYLIQSLTIHT